MIFMVKTNKSKFLKISCPRCKKKKTVLGKSASLVKTSGGKSKIRAPVKEIIWN
jgi:ribosomal protein S27E